MIYIQYNTIQYIRRPIHVTRMPHPRSHSHKIDLHGEHNIVDDRRCDYMGKKKKTALIFTTDRHRHCVTYRYRYSYRCMDKDVYMWASGLGFRSYG